MVLHSIPAVSQFPCFIFAVSRQAASAEATATSPLLTASETRHVELLMPERPHTKSADDIQQCDATEAGNADSDEVVEAEIAETDGDADAVPEEVTVEATEEGTANIDNID